MKKFFKLFFVSLFIVFIIIQFIRPNKENPSFDKSKSIENVLNLPPNVASLLRNSCYDCHSYETNWPWYSNIAPISWVISHDVKEGREHLNFSNWKKYDEEKSLDKIEQIVEEIKEGEMPLPNYLLLHSDAKLGEKEIQILTSWEEEINK